MGYMIKVQKISRTRSTSYYTNIPTAVVETMEIEKAEEMEWILEDRDTLILRRTKPRKSLKLNQLRKYGLRVCAQRDKNVGLFQQNHSLALTQLGKTIR